MANISVIIPVYKVEKYISACLQSIADQTINDGIECILVDDCGGDGSIEKAREFIETYSGQIEFKIIYRENNGGLSAARNTGVKHATGEYLYFLDSDDEIVPTCLEKLWNLVVKYPEVELVQGSFFRDYSKSNIPNTFASEFSDDREYIKTLLLTFDGDIIKAQNRLIKKVLILNKNLFFKEGIIHEDNHWTFFLAKKVTRMAFCNTRTYYHRYNPTSITGNKNVAKEIHAYKVLIEDFCSNIDSFLYGRQKELILETLLFVKNNKYYESEDDYRMLSKKFVSGDSIIQKMIFHLMQNSKGKIQTYLLHFLIRLYKM